MIRFKMRFRELITTFVFLSRSASFFTVTAAESKALIRDIQTGYLLNCSFRAIRPYPWKKLPLLSGWMGNLFLPFILTSSFYQILEGVKGQPKPFPPCVKPAKTPVYLGLSCLWQTVKEYKELAEWTKDEYIPKMPTDSLGSRMVFLSNWNEFGGGHFIVPSTLAGFGYVDVVRHAL